MNDYKELLSQIAYCTSEESCNGCPLNSDNILDFCVDELLEKASDAIERLCADVARLEAENRAKESYIAETIGKVIEERDAAIRDLSHCEDVCGFCKHNNNWRASPICAKCGDGEGEENKWEWRGVQEVEHE